MRVEIKLRACFNMVMWFWACYSVSFRMQNYGIIGPFLAIIYQGSGNMICINKWESYTLNMVGGHQVKLYKGL